MGLNALDIVVVVGLIYSFYHGFTKGLIISLASLVGLVLGVYGAIHFSGMTADYLVDHWEIKIPILAFAITFLLILLIVYFIGKLLEKVVDMMALGIFNKIGGALFSALRMLMILAVLLILAERINNKFQLWEMTVLQGGCTYRYLNGIADALLPVLRDLLDSTGNTTL